MSIDSSKDSWYKKAQVHEPVKVKVPLEGGIDEGKIFKVLLFGVPSSPVFEIGELLSETLDTDLYNIERAYDEYFEDKIPAVRVDTGDEKAGSESQHGPRDPNSESRRRALDKFMNVPLRQPAPLSFEERIEIYNVHSGIIVTEIPDPILFQWLKNGDGIAIFIDGDIEKSVGWLRKRRKCFSCGATYHMKDSPPKHRGVCDRCGSDLYLRHEDKPASVRHQMNVWRSEFENFKKNLEESDLGFFTIKMSDCESVNDIYNMCEQKIFSKYLS